MTAGSTLGALAVTAIEAAPNPGHLPRGQGGRRSGDGRHVLLARLRRTHPLVRTRRQPRAAHPHARLAWPAPSSPPHRSTRQPPGLARGRPRTRRGHHPRHAPALRAPWPPIPLGRAPSPTGHDTTARTRPIHPHAHRHARAVRLRRLRSPHRPRPPSPHAVRARPPPHGPSGLSGLGQTLGRTLYATLAR